jgi:hypothetical protein
MGCLLGIALLYEGPPRAAGGGRHQELGSWLLTMHSDSRGVHAADLYCFWVLLLGTASASCSRDTDLSCRGGLWGAA